MSTDVMPRPLKCRNVERQPGVVYFKPRGIPLVNLEEVTLTIDEFEAIRLADLQGLYQQEAADKMEISRQTFGNIINSAHKKMAQVIVEAKALKIEGGVYRMAGMRSFKCAGCQHEWEIPHGTGRPEGCPQCHGGNIHRAEVERGHSRRGGRCGQNRILRRAR